MTAVISGPLVTDLISRIIYSLASAYIYLKSRDMFLFGSIFMLVGRIGEFLIFSILMKFNELLFRPAFMYVSEFMEIMVVNGIIGFFRAWIYITPNLIFAEHLPLSRYHFH